MWRRELSSFMSFILGQISVDAYRDIGLKKFTGCPYTMRNGSILQRLEISMIMNAGDGRRIRNFK